MRTLILSLVLASLFTREARADIASAARAFSEGQAAQLEGDYDHAAQDFELAFSIAPTAEALRSAVRNRHLAGQLPRAAALAEILLAQYAGDTESAKLAGEVIAAAKSVLARITVTCDTSCSLVIDGRAISIAAARKHAVFANPGKATLEITFDQGASVKRGLSLSAGDEVHLDIQAPAAKAKPAVPGPVAMPPPQPRAKGLPAAVPIVGGAVTLGLVGVGIWSGLDTIKAHDRYAANPTPAGWSDGRSRQLRTNILFGSAAAVGVTTTLVAIFWTRWHDEQPPVSITATPDGVAASFGGRF